MNNGDASSIDGDNAHPCRHVLRLFLSLDLDESFLEEASALTKSLRGGRLSRARWVARSAMHVTLRFLGDTDEALVPSLGALVEKLGARDAVDLRATSLVAFPNARRAKVLGLHLEDEGVIADIAAEMERGVTALGFTPDERAFRPHLTLARLREPADLRSVIAERSVAIAGRVTSVTLYRSELGQGPPTYTSLARAVLRQPQCCD